jgi:succinyl-diaminopimelate desuccinylase
MKQPRVSGEDVGERLVQRTLGLCKVPSPIGEEQVLCDKVQRWAEGRYGGQAVRRLGNALVISGERTDLPGLAGHLDTVPFLPGDGAVRVEGDRLYGKGASDMKGGIAVALELCETLPRGQRPTLLLYDREEGPYVENGLGRLFDSGMVPPLPLAICLEPTNEALQLGCLGSLHATLRFDGRSAHSARPWEGKNAIHAAADVLVRIASMEPREVVIDGMSFREVAQVTRAGGGTARNVLPDRFELNLNYRFAPDRSLEAAKEEVRRLGEGADDVLFTDLAPSGPPCRTNPHVQRLMSLGAQPSAKQAWTDVARFGAHGIDAINFGPGSTAQAHQVDEWCDIHALKRVYRQLWRLFTNDGA